MNTLSLTYYENLRQLLQAAPRSQLHNLCRELGFHSWDNAKRHPNYGKWSNNER